MLGSVGAGDVLTPVVGMVVPEVLLPIQTPALARQAVLSSHSQVARAEWGDV